MSKPELGTKRACRNCGARFYDLLKNPIVCPKCSTVFVLAAAAVQRRDSELARRRSGAIAEAGDIRPAGELAADESKEEKEPVETSDDSHLIVLDEQDEDDQGLDDVLGDDARKDEKDGGT
jgi:uncharacterized protein (TIGR02300 family)